MIKQLVNIVNKFYLKIYNVKLKENRIYLDIITPLWIDKIYIKNFLSLYFEKKLFKIKSSKKLNKKIYFVSCVI